MAKVVKIIIPTSFRIVFVPIFSLFHVVWLDLIGFREFCVF